MKGVEVVVATAAGLSTAALAPDADIQKGAGLGAHIAILSRQSIHGP